MTSIDGFYLGFIVGAGLMTVSVALHDKPEQVETICETVEQMACGNEIVQEPILLESVQDNETENFETESEQFYDSLETLSICVEAEAGNQDIIGKRLVVDVILNRVDSDIFPNDIESVISQPHQFATYSNGAMDRVKEPSEETFEAVRMELENRIDDDILYFTAGYYNPCSVPAYIHGNHYFGY